MKNYYDELEVSKNASKEVIEKAYKVLAKKYHPDSTQEADKKVAEEKFKKISEAYELLSNDEKRKQYDLELTQSDSSVSYEEYSHIMEERDRYNQAYQDLQSELNHLKNTNTSQYRQYQTKTSKQPDRQNNTYHDFPNETVSNNDSIPKHNISSSPKRTYYYTDTGKPASAWDYYSYKIKKFFSNVIFFLLIILVILLMLNAFTSFDIFNFFSRMIPK